MARRRFDDIAPSRLAVWSRRIAFFALLAALLSIIIVRAGILEFEPAMATFGAALAFSLLAALVALAAFVVIWREGLRGLSYALTAIFVGIVLNAYPGYLAYKWYTLPRIADITTDPIDPPRFEAIARLRNRNTNPPQYAGLYAAEQQRTAYPDVEPLMLSLQPNAAYEAAMAVIAKRKWQIMDAREPIPTRREGRIEAVARSPIMGFREDVVVRIRAASGETRLDIRSASRYGASDLGSNAARIKGLIDDIDTTASNMASRERPQAQPPAPVKKTPQPVARR